MAFGLQLPGYVRTARLRRLIGQVGCASLVAGFSLVSRAVPVNGVSILGIRNHGRRSTVAGVRGT